ILVKEPELGVAVATRLGAMGVRLSIDDFGTGYSSLANLKRLPLHALKIDRSFVRALATDGDGADLVAAIIALAHSLKLEVVAEGVETAAQLDVLRAQACDEYQGFLASPALDAASFAALMAGARAPHASAAAAPAPSPSKASHAHFAR
ncbi:MAG: EAL domain-containing protein, partial [Burkholderiales bacterium]|nr:EAL domain-containing protein [Burkholderiales bacterium]